MSYRLLFPSLGKTNIVYTFHEESTALWDEYRRSSYGMDYWAGAFDTYGDGMVQHCTEWCVQIEDAADYMMSLTAFLVEHPDKTPDILVHRILKHVKPSLVLFAAKVKHRDDKTQWYSMQEEKVSSSESKRHDKRWEAVPEWANGSYKAICQLIALYAQGMSRFDLYKMCRAVAEECKHPALDIYVPWDGAEEYIGIKAEKHNRTDLHRAYSTISALALSVNQRNVAEADVARYLKDRQKEPVA